MNILEIREALDELEGADAHVERTKLQQTVQLQYEETLEPSRHPTGQSSCQQGGNRHFARATLCGTTIPRKNIG